LEVIRIILQKEQVCTVVTIDGRLVPADFGELQLVRHSIQGDVVLDLSGLYACTNEGIAVLQDWLNGGAQLRKATPFLRLVLKTSN
jgi:hypothetical protein